MKYLRDSHISHLIKRSKNHMFSRSPTVLTLFALLWQTQFCAATETAAFPKPVDGISNDKNQYIIQYYHNDEGNQAKQSIIASAQDGVIVVNQIPNRNIDVVQFASRESAVNWRKGAKGANGVKYFEAGEKYSCIRSFYRSN